MDSDLMIKCNYLNIEYKVLEILQSGMLLVIPMSDYIKGTFPMRTLIIPGAQPLLNI